MTMHAEPLLFSEAEMRGSWPWSDLAAGGYDLIMADPPWRFSLWGGDEYPEPSEPLTDPDLIAAERVISEIFGDDGKELGSHLQKSAQAHYRTMTLDDIKALPVAGLAKPDCLLWLWATAPMLDLQTDVLKAWGFEFKTSGTWVKTTVNGKIAFGTGYVLRNAHEPFLIGTRGSPETTRSVRSVVMAQVREHSQKPDAAFRAAEELMPDARRVELFSRTNRKGWDAWGDEVGKLNNERHCHDAGRFIEA